MSMMRSVGLEPRCCGAVFLRVFSSLWVMPVQRAQKCPVLVFSGHCKLGKPPLALGRWCGWATTRACFTVLRGA